MEGHLIGSHMHTAIQFYQLQGPGALHLLGRIRTETVIMGGPHTSATRLSLFLIPGEDAIDAILTLASGTLLINMDSNFHLVILSQNPGTACLFSYPGWSCFLPSSFFPVPHLGVPSPHSPW